MKKMLNWTGFMTLTAVVAAVSTSALANDQLQSWNYGDLDAEDAPVSSILQGFDYRVSGGSSLEKHQSARVQIVVRKSMKERGYQFLTVTVDGSPQFEAPVSTAWERIAPAKTGAYRASTPPGTFMPDAIEPKRFSNKWQVWLKHVIRFNSGIWLHATTPDHFIELGAPASAQIRGIGAAAGRSNPK